MPANSESRSQRLAAAFAALIALIVAVAATGVWAVNSVNSEANHRYLGVLIPMRKSARDLVLQMVNEETGVRGYLITTRRSSLRPYLLARPARTLDLRTLRSVANDDPAIVPLVARAGAQAAALDRYFAHEIALVASGPGGVTAARQNVEAGTAKFDRFRATEAAILAQADLYTGRSQRSQDNDAHYATAVILVLAFASVGIAAVLAFRTARRNRLLIAGIEAARDREHDVASVLQQSLLPVQLPAVPGLRLASCFIPVGEGIQMGGDFYDVFEAGGAWYLVVGDVCGKGPTAARLTALCRNAIRTSVLSEHETSLPTVLRELNRVILSADRDPLQFCTVAIASVRRDASGAADAEIASAGHPPVLLRRAGGEVEPIERLGTVVGVTDDAEFTSVTRRLGVGDLLFMYTDGVTDARADGEVFGEGRLAAAVREATAPAQVVACIQERIAAFAGGHVLDDVAMLAAQVE